MSSARRNNTLGRFRFELALDALSAETMANWQHSEAVAAMRMIVLVRVRVDNSRGAT